MKFKDALRNMRELQLMTKGLLVSNIILGAGMVYGLISISGERERIVLVPPTLDQKAEIAWKSANKEYVKSFGLYIATLVGNMQPKSSTIVLDAVSAFMDADIYTEFRRQIMTLIEDPVFKSSGSVISFQPNSIQYEAETNRVFADHLGSPEQELMNVCKPRRLQNPLADAPMRRCIGGVRRLCIEAAFPQHFNPPIRSAGPSPAKQPGSPALTTAVARTVSVRSGPHAEPRAPCLALGPHTGTLKPPLGTGLPDPERGFDPLTD